ncbi:MAG: SPASM domain-containing protein [Acidobacteria bacterium]|nr:SPASM domain-containing protein [Acidobacteriota bacterium]
MIPHLKSAAARNYHNVPPPICVQVQVTSACTTQCVMCDHWSEQRKNIGCDAWTSIFRDLASFGVRSLVFSGGEPTSRSDLPSLLTAARQAGHRLGMYTNGTMSGHTHGQRAEVLSAIRDNVDWVSISIDGLPGDDGTIRGTRSNPRIELLREFTAKLDRMGVHLAATVTLQQVNSKSDLQSVSNFIRDEIGIPNVTFKFVTGSVAALEMRPAFLLDEKAIESLLRQIREISSSKLKNTNLDYIRECLSRGVFSSTGIAAGEPVKSLYADRHLRCFTPFLFSLIDVDGEVFPCCHLYRDNHGLDALTLKFRERHSMGNVLRAGFAEVWNGDRYAMERQNLELIDPAKPDFTPCGECTRHCQHNLALSKISTQLAGKLDMIRDELPTIQQDGVPIWF